MNSAHSDRFWAAPKAWTHSLIEGLRAGGIIAITVGGVRCAGWIFHTDANLVQWILTSGALGLALATPFFLIFTIWTRVDVWQNNRVKSK